MQVKVVSLARCSATVPTINLVKETARELGIDRFFACGGKNRRRGKLSPSHR